MQLLNQIKTMVFFKNKLNFIILYSILFHLSCGDVNGKSILNSNVAGKLNKENISIERPKLVDPKRSSEGRTSYLKPAQDYNRNIYDYSAGFDSFFNNINNYPQSSVSYYPFSLQNVDYLYPKMFNRFDPYTSTFMPKSFQSPLDIPAQENQIPFYRDAQYYEPESEYQVIKRLVPIAYTTHIVSPRDAISPAEEVIIDSNPVQEPISVLPYPNYAPLRSAAVGPNNDQIDLLLKALEYAAIQESSIRNSTDSYTSTTLQQKVEIAARLLILAPSFANQVFKCLTESEDANKFIQTAQNFNGRYDKKSN